MIILSKNFDQANIFRQSEIVSYDMSTMDQNDNFEQNLGTGNICRKSKICNRNQQSALDQDVIILQNCPQCI